MKKNGFVFIESVTVILVVVLSLTLLISSYALVTRKSKENEYYDLPSDKYLLYVIGNLGQNNEEYQKKKDNIKIDKNNDININEENNKNDINYGNHCIGDFNDNNIKGGIIVLTTEDNSKYEEH